MKAPTLPLLDLIAAIQKDRRELNRIGTAIEMEVARKSYLDASGRTMLEAMVKEIGKAATRLGARAKFGIGEPPTVKDRTGWDEHS